MTSVPQQTVESLDVLEHEHKAVEYRQGAEVMRIGLVSVALRLEHEEGENVSCDANQRDDGRPDLQRPPRPRHVREPGAGEACNVKETGTQPANHRQTCVLTTERFLLQRHIHSQEVLQCAKTTFLSFQLFLTSWFAANSEQGTMTIEHYVLVSMQSPKPPNTREATERG